MCDAAVRGIRLFLHLPLGRKVQFFVGGAGMKHGGNVWEAGSPGQWLDFSANLRPEGRPDWVLQVMMQALEDTRYYPDRAMNAARQGLAAWLQVPEEWVLPTAGGASAIDLMLSLHSGTVHVYPVTFGEYAERAAVHRRKCGVWQEQCAPGDTVMLCNPNNPTGHALSRQEMLDIFAHVLKQGGELVVDEAFIDFCPENSVKKDVQSGLAVVGSMTKTLCIPGVRLGYVCASPHVIEQLEKRALPWSLGTLASAVAAHLPGHEEQLRQDVQRNAARRAQLTAMLTQLQARVQPSQSNFLLVDFGRDMTNVVAFLKGKGILVRTCASFGLPPQFLRLAVKTEAENQRLIEALKKGLDMNYAR